MESEGHDERDTNLEFPVPSLPDDGLERLENDASHSSHSASASISITNVDTGTTTVREHDIWKGSSDYSPLLLEVHIEEKDGDTEAKRRTSKKRL